MATPLRGSFFIIVKYIPCITYLVLQQKHCTYFQSRQIFMSVLIAEKDQSRCWRSLNRKKGDFDYTYSKRYIHTPRDNNNQHSETSLPCLHMHGIRQTKFVQAIKVTMTVCKRFMWRWFLYSGCLKFHLSWISPKPVDELQFSYLLIPWLCSCSRFQSWCTIARSGFLVHNHFYLELFNHLRVLCRKAQYGS